MACHGRVKGGVVVLDNIKDLPEGAEVRVELVSPRANLAAIALIEEWLRDDSGYDEQTWPDLKQALEGNHTSARRLFRD